MKRRRILSGMPSGFGRPRSYLLAGLSRSNHVINRHRVAACGWRSDEINRNAVVGSRHDAARWLRRPAYISSSSNAARRAIVETGIEADTFWHAAPLIHEIWRLGITK